MLTVDEVFYGDGSVEGYDKVFSVIEQVYYRKLLETDLAVDIV